jgi:DNA-binding CsgD family transcriptional regulator
MAKSKKLFRGHWSESEVKLLRKRFPTAKTFELAKTLGRPLTAVRQKAYEMGLKTRTYLNRCWSEEEIQLLKRLFPDNKTRVVAEELNHSAGAVSRLASRLGLKKSKGYLKLIGQVSEPRKWSQKEVKLLKKLNHNQSRQEIAEKLGRSPATVSQKALRLGLKKKEIMRWTSKELVILKQMYGKTTALQIAQKLGRSAQSVRQKAHRLGLKKRKTYHRYKTIDRIPKEEAVVAG